MRKVLLVFKRLMLLGLVVIGTIVAVGFYSHKQSPNIVYVRDDTRQESDENVLCGRLDNKTHLFADMAAMSALTYKNYKKNEKLNEFANSLRFERVEIDAIKKLLMLKKLDYKGLGLNIWKSKDSNKRVFVLAFRGTVDRHSWHANFHYIFKWLPFYLDQYEQVQKKIPAVVSALIQKVGPLNKSAIVYTTGHSLGGGLAQHALYVDERIKTAFVFNSSPVTGWSDLEVKKRKTKDNVVYRIHEKGEILEFFRLLMKSTYVLRPDSNIDPYFKEYRFNLTEGDLRTQHGISQIARRFYMIQNEKCVDAS